MLSLATAPWLWEGGRGAACRGQKKMRNGAYMEGWVACVQINVLISPCEIHDSECEIISILDFVHC